jgi:hypothetical protein
MATATVANFLAPNAIFLCREDEQSKGNEREQCEGYRETCVALVANEEFHILEGEWCGIGGGGSMLPRAKKKIEAGCDHLGDRKRFDVAMRMGKVYSVGQYLNGHGLYSVGRVIGFGVAPKLALEPEVNLAERVGPWVFGPQARKVLANRTEGAFHSARFDTSLTGSKDALAILVGKDLKEEDRVPHVLEPRIDGDVSAEALPDEPRGIVGGGG